MNHQGTGMIGRIAQWSLAILGIIFVVMIYTGNDTGIDGGLWVTYIAFGLCAIAAVVFSFMGLDRKSLIGMGAFLVVLALAYFTSSDQVMPGWNISGSTSKWIGAGLTMMYLAMAGAIGAIVYGEITRLMK